MWHLFSSSSTSVKSKGKIWFKRPSVNVMALNLKIVPELYGKLYSKSIKRPECQISRSNTEINLQVIKCSSFEVAWITQFTTEPKLEALSLGTSAMFNWLGGTSESNEACNMTLLNTSISLTVSIYKLKSWLNYIEET